MASLAHVTRQNVLTTIDEVDAIGIHEFLRLHGYRRATRYSLRFRGRSYPAPKAILGVAAGLTHRQLQGGMAQVIPVLRRLRFEVRDGTRAAVDPSLARLAMETEFADTNPRQPELPLDPSAYFASGSNRPGEIRGLAEVGHDVGVAAPHVNAEAEAELVALAGTDIQVFVDSGAFSEVTFCPELGFQVVKPITDEDWTARLALYRRLASSLEEQVWLVAPDQVGSQDVTLERLSRYREQVRELASLGARVLVAIQKGTRTQAEFAREVDAILGCEWTPALPCKKAATTASEAAEFVASFPCHHVHLLGLGVRSPKACAFLQGIADADPKVSVSMDSCWITANVGRKGRKTPRRFTAARDLASSLVSGTARIVELAMLFAFGFGVV